MADETPIAPVETAPVAAPVETSAVVETAPIAAPVETKAEPVAAEPVAKPEAEAKAPIAAVEPEITKPETSLLAEATEDGKKPEEVKTEVEAAPVEVALPAFEDFAVPENIKLAEKEVGQFKTMLAQLELDTKADHRLVQEFGQKAVDMYIQERKKDVELQMKAWTDTRKDWVKQIREDPVLGRNRFETNLRDAARVRDMFATDRFKEMIEYTGAGDHPGMMDFVHNIAKFLEKNGLLREGKPVAAPPSRGAPAKGGPRSRYQQPGA
jgi:hypothetical protein